MLPLARKFVYDIIPKTSIFSHDVEVNVSLYHSCAYGRTKDRLRVENQSEVNIN